MEQEKYHKISIFIIKKQFRSYFSAVPWEFDIHLSYSNFSVDSPM